MAKDLAQEYLKVRSRLFAERDAIVKRLAVLEQLLKEAYSAEPPAELAMAASAEKVRPRRRATPDTFTADDPNAEALPGSSPAEINWGIRPDAHDFPVAMFPFPARAQNVLERNGIHRMGDLNRLNQITLHKQRGVGKSTFQEVKDLIQRVNRGELFYPANEAVPTNCYARLVDIALAEMDQSASVAVQQRLGNEVTLEEVGSQLGVTKERVRQLEGIALGQLTRFHGAKLYQIGKALGAISKTRPVRFSDISDEANPPKFSAEFYLALLGRMFPGLDREMPADGSANQSDTPNGLPAPVAPEPPSPDELRERIFFGSQEEHAGSEMRAG